MKPISLAPVGNVVHLKLKVLSLVDLSYTTQRHEKGSYA